MNKSIKYKLIYSFIVIMAVSMLVQVIFNVFMYRRIYIDKRIEQIEKTYSKLEEKFNEDPEELHKILRRPQNTYNLKVLIKSNEEIIYSNDRTLSQNEFIPATEGLEVTEVVERASRENRNRVLLLKKGIINYKGIDYEVMILSRVISINDNIILFTKSSLIISGLITMVGTIMYSIFARRISSLIKNVENVANKVSNLEFTEKAKEDVSIDELKSLSISINSMSDKLEDNIIRLKSANEMLNERIDYQERVNEMRKSFVANASHEMKTPLSIILMYSESLKNNISKIDKDYYCDTIVEESQRLNNMVMQLLDISSIEKGLSKIQYDDLNLSDLARRVVEKSKLLLKEYDFSYEIEDDINIIGDEKYLVQAMENYINNAKDHTKAGDAIRIELLKEGENGVFKVFNKGESIPDKDLPYIWDSFYGRSERRKESEDRRIGLGLYIVKTIIQAHMGECAAINHSGGVEFRFTIKS